MLFIMSLNISANNSLNSYFITYKNTFQLMNRETQYISKEYVQGNMKYRNETEKKDSITINILRIDKNVIWSLKPEDKTYTEEQITDEILDNWTYRNVKNKSTKIEQEKILYQDCDLYNFNEKVQIYGMDVQRTVKYWFLKDTNIILKRDERVGSLHVINEATEIKFEEPTDDLFEIPNNYIKR